MNVVLDESGIHTAVQGRPRPDLVGVPPRCGDPGGQAHHGIFAGP